MALRWVVTSMSKNGPRTAFQHHTSDHRQRNLHSGQFITKFFDVVEDTHDQNEQPTPIDESFQGACETCAGSSHCLNVLHQRELKTSWGLKPLLFFGICVAFVHKRQKGRTCCKSPSCLFSMFILLVVWANFLRFFANYSETKSYGTKLFMKLTMHVWYGQVATSMTYFFFHVSPRLPRFFSTWNSYNRQYQCTTAHHIRSRAVRHLLLMFLFVAGLTATSVCVMIFEDPHRESLASKTLLDIRNISGFTGTTFRVGQAIGTIYTIYSVSAWIWPVAFIVALSSGLKYNYREVTSMIAKNYKNMDVQKLESTRRRHQKLCAIVRQADDLFSVYNLLIYMTAIPLICFTIYNFAFRSTDDSTPWELAMLIIHLVSICGQLILITFAGSSLSKQAVAPKEELLDVQFDVENKLCHLKAIQVMLFLHRLSHSHIGFTAWKLFNITRTTIMTVTTMILSNVFVLIKFGLTLEPRSKAISANCSTSH